ncbi:Na+/H+ antiporter NhaC [bacterium]|nr:Na+/H+ antiporter NhaC [bacterium]
MQDHIRPIPLIVALIPIIFLIMTLVYVIAILRLDAHIPLILSTAVAATIAAIFGMKWIDIRNGIVHGITLAMGSILILMIVGTMIGTWILGGIVPSMIYYGLEILSPKIFLFATLLICSIVSLGTGSSWSTAGTVGVALIGVGKGLGIPVAMVAGAIISGSYFGDKMSPLSDTTNLAPAVAGTDIFTHIRHMVYTTVPAYIIAAVLYLLIGFHLADGQIDAHGIESIKSALGSNYTINPVLLIPPILVIVMVIFKVPPLPALLGGTVLGGIFGMAFQSSTMPQIISAAFQGTTSATGIETVDSLLTRGGLTSMMNTVALIMCALSFGGIMEKTGMLQTMALSLLKRVKRPGSLIATTIFSCISSNIITCDQYMSIVIPGRMYKDAFDAFHLHPKNLSRCLEDSATLSSSLIPWNSGGAYMYATLGVYPLLYLPYAFLNYITPMISIFYGYTGITIEKTDNKADSGVKE